jgi:hypothetical protein
VLPAFVIADDKVFFSKLEGIDSFQKKWFMKPAELAAQWQDGKKPQPVWPKPNRE